MSQSRSTSTSLDLASLGSLIRHTQTHSPSQLYHHPGWTRNSSDLCLGQWALLHIVLYIPLLALKISKSYRGCDGDAWCLEMMISRSPHTLVGLATWVLFYWHTYPQKKKTHTPRFDIITQPDSILHPIPFDHHQLDRITVHTFVIILFDAYRSSLLRGYRCLIKRNSTSKIDAKFYTCTVCYIYIYRTYLYTAYGL